MNDLLPSLLCTALMRVGTRMATEFDQRFARFGLTQAQFRLLLAILDQGGTEGIAPSVLADHLLIERATVSVLTARLVERELLARVPGGNRRTFFLILTRTGLTQLEEVIPQAIALADETLAQAGIDRNEIQQGLLLLEKIETHLRAEDASSSKDLAERRRS